jgi:hypothetical protein
MYRHFRLPNHAIFFPSKSYIYLSPNYKLLVSQQCPRSISRAENVAYRLIRGYHQQHYHQLLLGLFAVLRSRRTGSIASHGKFSTAALRGTCFHPPSLQRLNLYWAFTTLSLFPKSNVFQLSILCSVRNNRWVGN